MWVETRSVRFCLGVAMFLAVPRDVVSQDAVTLQGLVLDSLARPIAGVQVAAAAHGMVTQTGGDGRFRLIVDAGNEITLDVTKPGFVPRRFIVSLNFINTGFLEVGDIVLRRMPANSKLLTGVVVASENSTPVSGVPIHLNDRAIAVTDSSGTFRVIAEIDSVSNVLRIDRLGFETMQHFFTVADERDEIRFQFELTPAPYVLNEIEVVGESSIQSRRLAGFERRRAQGGGHFFDANDIDEMNAVMTSDIVRRVPGVRVEQGGAPSAAGLSREEFRHGVTPHGTQTRVFLGRRSTSDDRPSCEPAYYLDDIKLATPDIDMLLQPGRLAGMEVYLPGGLLPAEFTNREAACGVIVMWSKDGMAGGTKSPAILGFHYGVETFTGSLRQGRIGGQLVIPFVGSLQFNPSFNVVINAPQASNTTSFSGWQVNLNLRRRLFGPGDAIYVGGGFTAFQIDEIRKGDFSPVSEQPVTFVPLLSFGASLQLGDFAPFAEFQWMGLVKPDTWRGVIMSGIRFKVAR